MFDPRFFTFVTWSEFMWKYIDEQELRTLFCQDVTSTYLFPSLEICRWLLFWVSPTRFSASIIGDSPFWRQDKIKLFFTWISVLCFHTNYPPQLASTKSRNVANKISVVRHVFCCTEQGGALLVIILILPYDTKSASREQVIVFWSLT